jgi:dephospho-CoA kinase
MALTGGIACGKSRVAALMSARGIAVCEADQLAHRVMVSGAGVYESVVRRFGHDVVGPDGMIDRAALGARVFGSEADRIALNALVHPAVEAAWTAWLRRQTVASALVAPLLFEAGYDRGWDAVICVCASLPVRMVRLRERGLSVEQAEARIGAQWPEEEKAARSDYVLWNDGSIACLESQVERVLGSMGRQE